MVVAEGNWVEGVVVCWKFLGLWGEDAGNVCGGVVYKLANQGEFYEDEGECGEFRGGAAKDYLVGFMVLCFGVCACD